MKSFWIFPRSPVVTKMKERNVSSAGLRAVDGRTNLISSDAAPYKPPGWDFKRNVGVR